jgi:hypothetical protein
MTRAAWIVLGGGLAACAGGATESRYSPRPEGCPVQILEGAPSVPTDNIGTARATCATDVSREDCLRELKDQACRLGGDMIWGVADAPRQVGGKNAWDGRVAHTR